MTWTSFHHRGEILRTVINTADERHDGALPMDLDGVRETFADELDLLGALQLKWHTRLAGRIERELMNQPMDLEAAVVTAWHRTADELPGVRAILDRHRQRPTDDAMAEMIAKSLAKEHQLLAVMAGLGNARRPADRRRRCPHRGPRRAPGRRTRARGSRRPTPVRPSWPGSRRHWLPDHGRPRTGQPIRPAPVPGVRSLAAHRGRRRCAMMRMIDP